MRVLADIACGRVGEGIVSSLFWVPDVETINWNPAEKPIMDMFDETNPDILLLNSERLSMPELAIASSRYPNTKIISTGKINSFILEPHLNISNNNDSTAPTILFEDAAMIGIIGSPSEEECLRTDLLCLTDYLDQNETTLSTLALLCDKYNIKIFGRNKVNFPHYLGQVDSPTRARALASTSVYIDLDGGSWYDGAWLGKECVSISHNCFRSFSSTEELLVAVDAALNAKEDNSQEIKMMVKNQTYFELVGEILSFFGLMDQRNKLMEKKKGILC